MNSLKCSCTGCNNIATNTWSGHPTCDSCGSPCRINETVKPFDITKHEFSSVSVSCAFLDCDYLNFNFKSKVGGFFVGKDDAIAIATALGVTGEDLK